MTSDRLHTLVYCIPPNPDQGNEQFSERVLDLAEKILYNLQKGIVDST
jgi:hypothetical protein